MEQGEIKFLIILFSTVLFILTLLVLALMNYLQKKKVEFVLKSTKEKAFYENALLTSKVEIAEQVLQNVSWELHDNIGQLLSAAVMNLKMIDNTGVDTTKQISGVSEILSTSIQEIRSLSKSLNHEMINQIGLIDAIKNELNRIERVGVLKTTLISKKEIVLDKNKEIIIFRMLQEFISNTIKHADALNLHIKITQNTDILKIHIQDDGSGFEVDVVKKNNGMLNLESRARLLRAELSLISEVRKGTEMIIKVPVECYPI